MYSNELVCNVLDYINNNINNEITIEELCIKFFYERSYLMKKFKKEIGITIHQYINDMRILNSLNLYLYDNYVLSIALKNGFTTIEYYSETFTKIIGCSPRVYKRFITRSPKISNDERMTIINNVHQLILIKDNVSSYLLNRKPDFLK